MEKILTQNITLINLSLNVPIHYLIHVIQCVLCNLTPYALHTALQCAKLFHDISYLEVLGSWLFTSLIIFQWFSTWSFNHAKIPVCTHFQRNHRWFILVTCEGKCVYSVQPIPLLDLNLGAILPRMGPKLLWYHKYIEVIFRYSRYDRYIDHTWFDRYILFLNIFYLKC